MLDAARPYPAYKDSGQPWLGEVPEHWEVRRLKYCVGNVSDIAPTPGDETPYIGLEHVHSWTGRAKPGKSSEVAGQVKRYGRDDVLFAKLRPYLAKVTRTEGAGVCTGELLVLRPTPEVSAGYAAATLCSARFINWVNSTTFGAKMPRAEWDVIGTAGFPVPPPPEQAAIVKVLSAVDRRVNRLVRAKRRLLALLAEQKQAVITHAVTRGLDPSAPTKPSGVPWLGEVPAHWEVKRLGSIFRERGDTNEDASMGIGDILSVTRTRGVIPYAEKGNIGNSYSDDINRYKIVGEGDLVINCMNVIIGSLGLSRFDGCLSPVYYVLQLRDKQNCGRYFEAIFQNPTFHKGLVVYGKGILAHRMRIPMDALKTVLLPLPPAREQREICESFADQSRQFDAAADLARREIDLIREYRTRLVADVVTGKLDVRAVADALPDEAEDEEPIDLDEAEAEVNADEPELVEELTSH